MQLIHISHLCILIFNRYSTSSIYIAQYGVEPFFFFFKKAIHSSDSSVHWHTRNRNNNHLTNNRDNICVLGDIVVEQCEHVCTHRFCIGTNCWCLWASDKYEQRMRCIGITCTMYTWVRTILRDLTNTWNFFFLSLLLILYRERGLPNNWALNWLNWHTMRCTNMNTKS